MGCRIGGAKSKETRYSMLLQLIYFSNEEAHMQNVGLLVVGFSAMHVYGAKHISYRLVLTREVQISRSIVSVVRELYRFIVVLNSVCLIAIRSIAYQR